MSTATIVDGAVGRDEILGRIDTLREELAKGRRRATALEAEREELRETVLRISGAIQVLEELLHEPEDEQGG
jgi:hypothetical protein